MMADLQIKRQKRIVPAKTKEEKTHRGKGGSLEIKELGHLDGKRR